MTQWPAAKVESRALDALVRDARTRSDDRVARIAASMSEWGRTIPIPVDVGGTIIAGHGQVIATSLLGFSEAPVIVARGCAEDQKRADVLADTKLGEAATRNDALLADELAQPSAVDIEPHPPTSALRAGLPIVH